MLGGVATMIFRLGIFVFLIIELINVINKKSTITNSRYVRNLALDKTVYHLDQSNFDIAYRLLVRNQSLQNIDHDMYFQVHLLQLEFEWINNGRDYVETSHHFDFAKCDETRFAGEIQQASQLGIFENYNCPKNLSLHLVGSYNSNSAKMGYFSLGKCTQQNLDQKGIKKKCASEKDIYDALDQVEILVTVLTSYIDVNDVSPDPRKNIIKILYSTVSTTEQQSNVYKISQNYAILQDSSLQKEVNQNNLTYYDVRNDDKYLRRYVKSENNFVFGMNFLLDDSVQTMSREVHTIADALANTGGFMGIFFTIISLLVSSLQENLFYQSLIKNLYSYDQREFKEAKEISLEKKNKVIKLNRNGQGIQENTPNQINNEQTDQFQSISQSQGNILQ
eukprot:403335868